MKRKKKGGKKSEEKIIICIISRLYGIVISRLWFRLRGFRFCNAGFRSDPDDGHECGPKFIGGGYDGCW